MWPCVSAAWRFSFSWVCACSGGGVADQGGSPMDKRIRTGRERERKRGRSKAERHRPPSRWNWPRALGLAMILLLIGLVAGRMILHRPDQSRLGAPLELQSQSAGSLTDAG